MIGVKQEIGVKQVESSLLSPVHWFLSVLCLILLLSKQNKKKQKKYYYYQTNNHCGVVSPHDLAARPAGLPLLWVYYPVPGQGQTCVPS